MPLFIHRMTFIWENRYCFLATLTDGKENKDWQEDKELVGNEICYAIQKRIEKIITEKSAKNRVNLGPSPIHSLKRG